MPPGDGAGRDMLDSRPSGPGRGGRPDGRVPVQVGDSGGRAGRPANALSRSAGLEAGAHDPPGSQDASSRRQAGRRRGQPACTCRRAGLTAELNVLVVVRRTRARNHHEQGERRSTSGPGLASYPYARSADRGRSEHSPMLRRGSRSPGNGLRLGRFASACRGQHMSAAGTAASTTRACGTDGCARVEVTLPPLLLFRHALSGSNCPRATPTACAVRGTPPMRRCHTFGSLWAQRHRSRTTTRQGTAAIGGRSRAPGETAVRRPRVSLPHHLWDVTERASRGAA